MKKYIKKLLLGSFAVMGLFGFSGVMFAQVKPDVQAIKVTLKLGLIPDRVGIHGGCDSPVLQLGIFNEKEQEYNYHDLSFALNANGEGVATTKGPVLLRLGEVRGFAIRFAEMTLNVKDKGSDKWQYLDFAQNQIPNALREFKGFKFNGNYDLDYKPSFSVKFNGYGGLYASYTVSVTITSTYEITGQNPVVTYVDGITVILYAR